MPHAGLVLGEMDVDAVIRRKPELALVDELAHTNSPGSRNEKRYQDIDEILEAGIDVISTVNIQHLESLNDTIFELTDDPGPRDLPRPRPRRSRRGRARRPRARGAPAATRGGQGLSEGAGRGRPGQLLPPRQPQLAARARAARGRRGRRSPAPPDDARAAQPASRLRADSGPDRAAAEVAADPPPCLALRPAARLRDRRGLGAASPVDRPPTRKQRSLPHCDRLASVLGVHFLEEEGDDLVATVRRVAYERGSTYIFVGTPDERRRVEILRGSLLSRMVRELPGIDIRVVANRADRPESPS